MKYLSYLIFVGLGRCIALLPMRVLYIISDILYPLVYYVIGYRKKVVFENLRNSFPEKSEEEIEIIAKKFYHHFCDLLVEIVKVLHISAEELKKRMKYRDVSGFKEEFKRNKHILVVLGHYNNWEWGCCLGMQGVHRFATIYKPLKNKYFDNLMIKMRTQFGDDVVPMVHTPRYLMEQIQKGELTQLNFIADQSPYQSDIRYWTTFLNQETPVLLGIEKLARKTHQPVYFAKFYKIKRGYYEVEVIKLCDDCSLLAPYELTNMHVKALEELIREAPENWLWTHRRWKHKREQ
ncbi:MAG TPA: lysophospholipid acyltransferase family protein [Bacteroidales bacterium]